MLFEWPRFRTNLLKYHFEVDSMEFSSQRKHLVQVIRSSQFYGLPALAFLLLFMFQNFSGCHLHMFYSRAIVEIRRFWNHSSDSNFPRILICEESSRRLWPLWVEPLIRVLHILLFIKVKSAALFGNEQPSFEASVNFYIFWRIYEKEVANTVYRTTRKLF